MYYFIAILCILLGATFVQVPPPSGGPGCQGWLQGSNIMLSTDTLTVIAITIIILLCFIISAMYSGFMKYLTILVSPGLLTYVLITHGQFNFYGALAWCGVNWFFWGVLRTVFGGK